MKTEKRILIAFLLNLFFSVLELVGGALCGSTAILSDAIHDFGDAASIGMAWILEKISKKKPDAFYTYGYARYSVLGGLMTSLILMIGSAAAICQAVNRLLLPIPINYNGMIGFAVLGVCVNFSAAFFTRGGHSLNQRAVRLHMLEDVLGWVVVLIGAVVMKFTDFSWMDSMMSIGVALLIFGNAILHMIAALEIILERVPRGISVDEIRSHVLQIEGVCDVHHVHIRSLDGQNYDASMHITAHGDFPAIKRNIREELREHGIVHVTLELESVEEYCPERQCQVEVQSDAGHHHHHHHGTKKQPPHL